MTIGRAPLSAAPAGYIRPGPTDAAMRPSLSELSGRRVQPHRLAHIAVNLKGLAQPLAARQVGQSLPTDGYAGAWQCAGQAVEAGQQ